MAEIKALVRKRGDIKRKLTIFTSFVNELKDSVDKASIIQLDTRLTRATDFFDQFSEIHNKIRECCDDDELSIHDEEADTFESCYYQTISFAHELLNEYKRQDAVSSPVDSGGLGGSTSDTTSNQAVKLPTIQLPKFNGNFENWLEFKDSFESLIHLNDSLNAIQKFHYLRATLSGTASQVIQCLEFSAANYIVAWEALLERFNNRRLLVYNHINSIFEITSITKECSIQIRAVIDNVDKHLRALEILGEPVDNWDTLIIHIISKKLDYKTLRDWESELNQNQSPKYNAFKQFLNKKSDLLETIESNVSQNKYKGKPRQTSLVTNNKGWKCNFCKKNHSIYQCQNFLELGYSERIKQVENRNLCKNCLLTGHKAEECSHGHCRRCSSKHNTLLHQENVANVQSGRTVLYSNETKLNVLLPTALVQLRAADGSLVQCRALLDSGSQSNFITKPLFDKLHLRYHKSQLTITGIGAHLTNINRECSIKLLSCDRLYRTKLNCLIIEEICNQSPGEYFELPSGLIPNHINLADPGFNTPNTIDLLIGAGTFWEVIGADRVELGKHLPILQDTKLGWLVTGNVSKERKNLCGVSVTKEIHNQLRRFWELEEVDDSSYDVTNFCETHFVNNYTRNSDGRFVVKIPFNDSISRLGNSYKTAEKRLISLERKFELNPQFLDLYKRFMDQYERLGHMSELNLGHNNLTNQLSYLLPHHGVLKEDSKTTKLRVVFDGSVLSNSAISLNDCQFNGPTIQEDLLSILLRFRKHTYVISADIKQMYRQILIHPDDRKYQRILWRDVASQPIKTFELNTVTYGTRSAPFLAIRSLYQLGIDYATIYPLASNTIKRDFYVDDLLTGGDDRADVASRCLQIRAILKTAGFELHKWVSNDLSIIKELELDSSADMNVSISPSEFSNALGILYSNNEDIFMYKYKHIPLSEPSQVSKRLILSTISRLYDPFGLLAPFIIKAKVILQQLWISGLTWDEPVNLNVANEFIKFNEQLLHLEDIKVPRRVIPNNKNSIEYHGFCDASKDAYGACIYIKTIDCDNTISVSLLCAKSRVAPLKTITIPRLELCGAVLLAKLMNKVDTSLGISAGRYFWCDSQVVLHWIHSKPQNLKQFVSHRISTIQSLSKNVDWRYVQSRDNPADVLSRGMNLKMLQTLTSWWRGPSWLHDSELQITDFKHNPAIELPELNLKGVTLAVQSQSFTSHLFSRFSSFSRLERVVAYCLRFLSHSKNCQRRHQSLTLTALELSNARKLIIKLSQLQEFKSEIDILVNNKQLSKGNKLLSLAPFVDNEGLLRVGGRLKFSDLPLNMRHPSILSAKNRITELIFREAHARTLHGGPQLLLATVRQQYWPIGGRNLARKIVHECIRCFRFNSSAIQPIMSSLPKQRVSVSFPFEISGVDYAGPFNIKDRKGKKPKITKAYVCLFICFTTKAIHLELVSDLTTEAFMASLRRFVSRRGLPKFIYSDNGSTFIGANNLLKSFLELNRSNVSEFASKQGIEWKFIAPRSPHMGGLWEAGVKSVKSLLGKVMNNTINFTFEEFLTMLTQIEAVLNSRPLYPMSSDPNDLRPITPSHFLTGRELTAVPDNYHAPTGKINYLKRFEMVQRIYHQFWKLWQTNYLHELQQRTKWQRSNCTPQIGIMVLVREEKLPPQKWLLGRIMELHIGKDEIARVATVKTSTGIIKRCLNRLCPLPLEEHGEEK